VVGVDVVVVAGCRFFFVGDGDQRLVGGGDSEGNEWLEMLLLPVFSRCWSFGAVDCGGDTSSTGRDSDVSSLRSCLFASLSAFASVLSAFSAVSLRWTDCFEITAVDLCDGLERRGADADSNARMMRSAGDCSSHSRGEDSTRGRSAPFDDSFFPGVDEAPDGDVCNFANSALSGAFFR